MCFHLIHSSVLVAYDFWTHLSNNILNSFLQVLEIGSVGKGFDDGVKTFFAHPTVVRFFMFFFGIRIVNTVMTLFRLFCSLRLDIVISFQLLQELYPVV